MKSKLGFVSLTALLMLAGCGGESSNTDAQDVETIVIGSPTTHHEFVKGKVEAWLKAEGHDNVTVKMADLNESDAKNTTDWSDAAAPDLYAYASDQSMDLISKGALAQVPTTYVDEMKKNMKEADVDAAKIGDKYYAYPYAGDNGYYLYYNTDVVSAEQAKSVEGIIAACTEKGMKFGYALDTDSSFFSIGTLFSFGARYNVTLDAQGQKISKVTADFNTEKGLKAAKAIQSLAANPNVVIEHKSARDLAPTAANKFGAVVEGSWNYDKFTEQVGDKLACAKLPTITVDGDTKNLGSFLGYKLYGVNPMKSAGNPDRLALLHTIANYLVSDSVQEDRWDSLKIAPTAKSVAAMDKVTSDDHIKAINDQAQYSVAQTIVPGGIWSACSTLVSSIQTKLDATEADLQGYIDVFNTAVTTVA